MAASTAFHDTIRTRPAANGRRAPVDVAVRWLDTVQYLMRQGTFECEELGPGEVLTKLVKSVQNTAAFS